MKKTLALLPIMAICALAVIATPNESSALPSFSRQTGNPCRTCHFQHFTKLNAEGRNFKLNGYTDTSADLIEDDYLSLRTVLPLSFVVKMTYEKTSQTDQVGPETGTDRGELLFPEESSFVLGGRFGEHIGGIVDYPGQWGSGKIVFTIPVGQTVAGVVVYSTDNAGPMYGMELSNNGVTRGQYGAELREENYAWQKLMREKWDGRASGIGVYTGSDWYIAYVSAWGPAISTQESVDTNFNLSLYYRVAVTGDFGGWELMFGAFGMTGPTQCVACVGNASKDQNGNLRKIDVITRLVGLDFQLQKEFHNGMTLGFTAEYADSEPEEDDEIGPNEVNLIDDSKAWSFSAQFGITERFGVTMGYVNYTNEQTGVELDQRIVTGGAYFDIAQNVMLYAEYASFNNDIKTLDDKFIFGLFFAL